MSDPLTEAELDALEKLNDAASDPDWRFGEFWGPDDRKPYVCVEGSDGAHLANVFSPGDAVLVNAARNALPRLLAEVRAGRHLAMLCWCKGDKHTGEPLCEAAREAIRAAERGERPVQPEGLSGYWWCGLCLRWYSFPVSECAACKSQPETQKGPSPTPKGEDGP